MAFHINNVGTWKPCVVWINNVGTWKKAAVWLNVSGVWKQITTLFTANYPTTVDGYGSGFASSGSVSTGTSWTAPTYTGASGGSKTFSWSKVSGHASVGISSTTVERPSFSAAGVIDSVPMTAVYSVTVTDAGSTSTDTVNISLNWTNLY